MKRHLLIGCFACVLGIATMSHGQAIPTASRTGSIQVGVGGMFTNPDYAQQYIKGLTFYADYEFLHNSAERMNALLARLSQNHRGRTEAPHAIEIVALVERVAAQRKGQHPVVTSGVRRKNMNGLGLTTRSVR